MSEVKRKFRLNTAITGIRENDGKFNDEQHKQQVLPLRGRLMQLDGVTGCHIGRYEIEVQYHDDVVSRTAVARHVRAAVQWAANRRELFPLRGEKKPRATLVTYKREKQHVGKLWIDFGTNVVRYQVSDEDEGWDEEEFRRCVQDLAKTLTDFDGVSGYALRLRTAWVSFDTRGNTREAVEAYVRAALDVAAAGEEFFPYVGEGELRAVFQPEFSYTEE